MANPVFPTLSQFSAFDSSAYGVFYEDTTERTALEGGYVLTRAKHTRLPRQTFTGSYRMLTDADKVLLVAFFNSVRGGSAIFDWTNPQNGLVYAVRMTGALSFKYVGRGTASRWDCPVTFEQA